MVGMFDALHSQQSFLPVFPYGNAGIEGKVITKLAVFQRRCSDLLNDDSQTFFDRFLVCIQQQQVKQVCCVTAEKLAFFQVMIQHIFHITQHAIPAHSAKQVVDTFEIMDVQSRCAERLFCFQYPLEIFVKVGCIFCPSDGVLISQTDQAFDILAKDTASTVKQYIHENQHQHHQYAKDGQSIAQ